MVLVNRMSASASEIFAGAIQDYSRGLIVGDRSFGKGTVQTLIPLTEGQLKITESKFYRISGDSTQHRGVVPDLEFPSIYDAEEIGESSLDHALNWDQINPVRHHRYNDLSTVVPRVTAMYVERSAGNPDFVYLQEQVELARASGEISELPLNEVARMALRESQEQKALLIENKRRKAKGEEPLASLDEEEEVEEDQEAVEEGGADLVAEEEAESEEPDVLLSEAGNVLVDVLLLKERAYAVHTPEKKTGD